MKFENFEVPNLDQHIEQTLEKIDSLEKDMIKSMDGSVLSKEEKEEGIINLKNYANSTRSLIKGGRNLVSAERKIEQNNQYVVNFEKELNGRKELLGEYQG